MSIRRAAIAKLLVPIALIGSFAFPSLAAPAGPGPDKYVRTMNYYLLAGTAISSADHEKLAKHDVIVLPAEAQVWNRDLFIDVRRLNPDIIILAYISSKSWNSIWSDPLHEELWRGMRDEWKLRDSHGNDLSVWPGTWSYNANSGWPDYLARFMAGKVNTSGLWDGIFYDEFSTGISWLNGGDIDLDRDGRRDDRAVADRLWEDGMIRMLKTTRSLIGPDKYIITNGDSDADIAPYVNGRMFESFPTPWEGNGSWAYVMNSYMRVQKQAGYAPLLLINGNTNNQGNNTAYSKVRFGLASTLLGDGYFGFDYGTESHAQFWDYDEYGVRLGRPAGPPKNLTGGSDVMRPGLWKRDFENGMALVNSTDKPQTYEFEADYERIHGSQDPRTNSGEIASTVTIPPFDGLILQRPLDKVTGAAYRNGAFLRVLTSTGAVKRNGFFAYASGQRGGANLAELHIRGLGDVLLVAKGNRLEARAANGAVLKTVYPFGSDFGAYVNFTVSNVAGKTYVAAGVVNAAAPTVRAYNDALEPMGAPLMAYDAKFWGGVNASVGDVDGDGALEIVTGTGIGHEPEIRVYGLRDYKLKAKFLAYDARFKGGVNVGAGDVDGDGRSDIVTGTGFSGGPHVRVFDGTGGVKSQFFAYDSKKRSGVRISVADIDGDGRTEILAMTNDVFSLATGQ